MLVNEILNSGLSPAEMSRALRKICKRLGLDPRGARTYRPDGYGRDGYNVTIEVWCCRYGPEMRPYTIEERCHRRDTTTFARCLYLADIIRDREATNQ